MHTTKTVLILLIAGFLLLTFAHWPSRPDFEDFFRLGILCLLCHYLYRGANWARCVLGVLAALGCLWATLEAIGHLPYPEYMPPYLLTAVFYGLAAWILFTGWRILGHFQRGARRRRK